MLARHSGICILAFTCLMAPFVHGAQNNLVTFESLLDEMVDRERLARFPVPEYRLRQQSSYDRRSTTPAEPIGWFANKDRGNFIRTEINSGRKEWVLMEHRGAGAMGRVWMPDPRITPMVLSGRRPAPRDLGTLRIYLDSATDPVLEGPTYDLLNGSTIASYPFGHRSLSSAVSYLPIPWATNCKVTMDVAPQYFIFTYREYVAGTKVRTFAKDDLTAMKDKLQSVGKALTNPKTAVGSRIESMHVRVEPQDTVHLALPGGTHAIRTLSLTLDSYDILQITRSVVLKVECDGEETVWCPVGDFFGTGVGLHPFQGSYRTVGQDGKMSCRWVMPYRSSAVVSLANLYDQPVQAQLDATVGDWKWDDLSMYFHSNWRHDSNVKTRPRSDWSYAALKGQGVYVGDTLTVWNPNEIWWGEGDAKIWVDGESFPSIFGTGTEDYYAYSYGGQNRGFYQHPFHAQVRVMNFDQNYKQPVPIVRVTQGYSTETRTRAVDAMPFGESLKVDMGVWHWEECEMNLNVATYWYGRPAAVSNVAADPAAAKSPVRQLSD